MCYHQGPTLEWLKVDAHATPRCKHIRIPHNYTCLHINIQTHAQHTPTHAYAYTYLHTHTHAYKYPRQIHTHLCIQTYTHAHTQKYVHIRKGIYMCIQVCILARTYKHEHTHIRVYTHVPTHAVINIGVINPYVYMGALTCTQAHLWEVRHKEVSHKYKRS